MIVLLGVGSAAARPPVLQAPTPPFELPPLTASRADFIAHCGAEHVLDHLTDRSAEEILARLPAAPHPVGLRLDDERSIARLARTFRALETAGRPAVVLLEEAAGAGLSGCPEPEPPPRVDVATSWVASHLGDPGVVLLDVRDGRGWDEFKLTPTFSAGHIPGSLPLDPRDLLDSEQALVNPLELRKRFSTLGPRAGDPVDIESTFVLIGDSIGDPTVDLAYLTLRLAGLDVRVYPGGWRAWAEDEDRPVVEVVTAEQLGELLSATNPQLENDRPAPGVLLFDLRESWYFDQAHLPGAILLPADDFVRDLDERVREVWGEIDHSSTPLALYCFGTECVRSRDCAVEAALLGFRRILWFREGLDGWRRAGLPLFPDTRTRHDPAG